MSTPDVFRARLEQMLLNDWVWDGAKRGRLAAQRRYVHGTPQQVGAVQHERTFTYDSLARPTLETVTIHEAVNADIPYSYTTNKHWLGAVFERRLQYDGYYGWVKSQYQGLGIGAGHATQLAFLDGEASASLVDGARYLFTNEYEYELLLSKTGWTAEELDAKCEGADLTVAFNPDYLLQGIEVLPGDEVLIESVDSLKPALVKSPEHPEFLYLLMPVRVS